MKTILVSLAMLSVALAGCSGGGIDYVTPETDDEGRYIVKIVGGNKYSPANIEIPAGSTVVWMMESTGHNVDFDNGMHKTVISNDRGEHTEFTFDDKGTFGYHCDPHESLGMIGSVRVI